MTCQDVQERLAAYWDLPEDDPARREADAHIARCPQCRQEFELWRESIELVRILKPHPSERAVPPSPRKESIADRVMSRIYADESWRVPLPGRPYFITHSFRRKVVATIAAFLALFLFGFVYNLTADRDEPQRVAYGAMLEVASASRDGGQGPSFVLANAVLDPAKIQMGPLDYSANYLLALSLWGVVATLLILNWFTRLRQ